VARPRATCIAIVPTEVLDDEHSELTDDEVIAAFAAFGKPSLIRPHRDAGTRKRLIPLNRHQALRDQAVRGEMAVYQGFRLSAVLTVSHQFSDSCVTAVVTRRDSLLSPRRISTLRSENYRRTATGCAGWPQRRQRPTTSAEVSGE
jgi:hypothetical protein